MAKIIRGLKDVIQALTTDYVDAGLIGYEELGLPYATWQAACLEHVLKFDTCGYSAASVKLLGFKGLASVSTPLLAVHEGQAILLREYDTKDRGLIPVFAFELELWPTISPLILKKYEDMLTACGIDVIDDGRTDVTVYLPTVSYNSRITKALNRAHRAGFTTLPTSREFAYLDLVSSSDGQDITCQDTLHHLSMQYPQLFDSIPAAWAAVDIDAVNIREFDYVLDAHRVKNPPLDPEGYWKFYITQYNGYVVAFSSVWISGKVAYWVGTRSARLGEMSLLRKEFNATYAIIAQIAGHVASIPGVTDFNLGIDVFDYKKDFSSLTVTYPGLAYKSSTQMAVLTSNSDTINS